MTDAAAIHTEFVHANGLTVEVDQCGDGARLALCLHGFPECSYSWRFQLPMLARLGYTAWAPNLRGYRRSSRSPHIRDYVMPCLLADVDGRIDAAGKRSPGPGTSKRSLTNLSSERFFFLIFP